MKKKLIIGLGLVTCIFILSGIIIAANLSELRLITDLTDRQQKMVKSYDRMLYLISDDQSDLYALEAGYKRDLDKIHGNIRETRLLLSSLREGYAAYSSETACRNCHSRINPAGFAETPERIQHHEKTLEDISARIEGYDEKISRIVASGDAGSNRPLVKAAAADSEEIEGLIEKIKDAMDRMNERMEKLELAEVTRSNYTIVFAIALSILLSAAIVILMTRSITGPMDKLVHGIEKISSGDYNPKVSIYSNDEFGFLARTFNRMTDNLSEMTMQRETLLNKLTDLNNNLEQRVREATEELRAAQEMLLRNQTLSAVGTLASGVAHELATPISTIISYFGMIKGRLSAQDAEDADIIESELRRCRNILGGMLNFAREPEQDKSLTDVNAIIRDLLTLIKYQTEYRKVSITADLDSGLPDIMAVPGHLRQVFMNILLNALQSVSGTGEISVSTSTAGDGRHIVVGISDTGCGIPESEINKIFNPFYTTKESGTGLGLSISYGIIKSHGGEIEVQSEQGKGTTFNILLPVT